MMWQPEYHRIRKATIRDLRIAPMIPHNGETKILMLSDSHKGRGEKPPDDFLTNKPLYNAVLRKHQFRDFRHLDLGDDTDEWEEEWRAIWAAYEHELRLARSMYALDDDGEPVKVIGNHDRFVEFNQLAQQTIYGGVKLVNAVRIGDHLFASHGHRGDFWCDQNWKLSRWIVEHLWVPWQELTNASAEPEPSPFPSRNERRRTKLEKDLDRICIALDLIGCYGHTHRSYNTEMYWNCGSCLKDGAITGLRIIGFLLQRVQWELSGFGAVLHETVLAERQIPH